MQQTYSFTCDFLQVLIRTLHVLLIYLGAELTLPNRATEAQTSHNIEILNPQAIRNIDVSENQLSDYCFLILRVSANRLMVNFWWRFL